MKYIKATTVPQEIHSWFQGELESRGIDIVYSHTVMSLLLHADQEFGNRGAAVECLKSATEQKIGLETLVDELCRRLNNYLHPESHAEAAAAPPVEEPVKRKSPKELAQMYYAAFPALENSLQVQAQRVSWDGRRIIELHEREQQHAESVNWELLQEQQLRSKLDSPSLVAIWGRQASTAIGRPPYLNMKKTHIFDFFNSVWALSGEDKVMLKVHDKVSAKEKLHGSGASTHTEPLGAALAKVIAMLMEKHKCASAVFKDATLFWNWAKDVSDDPLLQAISTAGPAIFRKAGHLYASQDDCLATELVPAKHLSDKESCVENLTNLTTGEVAITPSTSGSKDLLAMGDVKTEPAKDSDNPWCGGCDPTRQLGYLDFEQGDIVSAEERVAVSAKERVAECSVSWPSTGVSSHSESQMTHTSERTTSSSLPSRNPKEETMDHASQFGAFMKEDNNRAGGWHPTWLEDFVKACPDAEVPPIFKKIQNQIEGATGKATVQSEACGTESKATSSGFFADSSLSKNKCKDPSLQKGHPAGHDSASYKPLLPASSSTTQTHCLKTATFVLLRHSGNQSVGTFRGYRIVFGKEKPSVQVDCAAAEWPWKVGSKGDLTTAAPRSPIRLGNKVFPEINSSNIGELRNELEAELDIILNNLYELSQPWDTILAACDASQETLPLQQPGPAPPKHPPGFLPHGFLPHGFLPHGFLPHGFLPHGTLPNTRLPNAQTQAVFNTAFNQQLPLGPRPTGFFMPNMHAMPGAPRPNLLEINARLCAPLYGHPVLNQYMPRYSVPNSALHSSLISSNSATGGFVSSDARTNLGVPSAEQEACGAPFSCTPGMSWSRTANPRSAGSGDASHKNSTQTCLTNCNVGAATYVKDLPATFVPNSNPVNKVKPNSLATSSPQHTPVYATNLPSAGCSAVSTMEAAHTVPPAGIRKNHMLQAHASQPRACELSNTQSHGFPQKILLPSPLPNNARGSAPDANTSEALPKTSSGVPGEPFNSVCHSDVTNESPVPEPSLPGPLPAITSTSSKSLPNLLPSTNPPPSTSLPGSSVCATTASDQLLHDTTLSPAIPKNSAQPPPTLPASVGNLNFVTIPWTLPQPSSHSSHETLPRPPAWHQRGPVPWTTQGIRAGPVNCPLPGHVAPVRVPQPAANQPPTCTLVSPHLNSSVAVHVPPVRASPQLAHRPSANTLASPQLKSSSTGHAAAFRVSSPLVNRPPALANPQMRFGPGTVPRQPWQTSWAPPWPANARWPVSHWPPLAPESRNPPEPMTRPLARPMHGSALSPVTWPPLRAGSAVVRQPITQPTSVCGIVPSFGQVAKLPPYRPLAAAGTAGVNTPQTPVTDSLLGPRPRLPPPASMGNASSPCSTTPQPNVKSGLASATSSASVTSTTGTTTSPPSKVASEPTAAHATSNVGAPVSRYSGVPAPRHAAKIAQGRCFKAPVGPGAKAALLNPVPRLPPRLAPRLAARLATRPPATPSYMSTSNSSKLRPESDKPVNHTCKDTNSSKLRPESDKPVNHSCKDTNSSKLRPESEKPVNHSCKDTNSSKLCPESDKPVNHSWKDTNSSKLRPEPDKPVNHSCKDTNSSKLRPESDKPVNHSCKDTNSSKLRPESDKPVYHSCKDTSSSKLRPESDKPVNQSCKDTNSSKLRPESDKPVNHSCKDTNSSKLRPESDKPVNHSCKDTNSSKLRPESDKPVNHSCKDTNSSKLRPGSDKPVNNSCKGTNSSKLRPESDKPVNQSCKDTSQMVPEANGQQPATGNPKLQCDVKEETKAEDREQNTEGECSPCAVPSVGPCSAWRKKPNIKGLAGASGHNSHDGTSKLNESAPALPEKSRPETVAAPALPGKNRPERVAVSTASSRPTSGRRRKRR